MQKPASIQRAWQFLFTLFLIVAGIILAKPFLVPLCFGGLLAMLFVPLCQRLEKAGLGRGIATLICVLTFLIVLGGIIALITWQDNNLAEDLGNIESKVKQVVESFKDFISEKIGISRKEQQEMIDKQSENASGMFAKLGEIVVGLVVDFILVIVYIFLFIYYRRHIKTFIRKLIPKKDDDITEDALSKIELVTQKYLTGVGIMIVCLWIMYSIGFTIVGLKNAFFFAIVCGMLEIVPFVGNFTGNMIAALMAVTQGGGIPMVVGVIITYGIVQFLQTYLLEPLVVGNEVNINPLFTIIGLVIGELLWGIPGMVLALPLMGIAKIVCDHIPVLQPYGFLIGREKKSRSTLVEKIKEKFTKK